MAPEKKNEKIKTVTIRMPESLHRDLIEIGKGRHGMVLNDLMIRAASKEIERLKKTSPVV